MKSKLTTWLALALLVCGVTITPSSNARLQSPAVYQQMSQAERAAFVSAQARRIAKEISGRDYEFTPTFEAAIQQSIERYVRRIGNDRGETLGKGDARLIFER